MRKSIRQANMPTPEEKKEAKTQIGVGDLGLAEFEKTVEARNSWS